MAQLIKLIQPVMFLKVTSKVNTMATNPLCVYLLIDKLYSCTNKAMKLPCFPYPGNPPLTSDALSIELACQNKKHYSVVIVS